VALTPSPLRVLQLNLCNSGFAGCYSGRAVAAAAALFADQRPDVVTLNEICRDDLPALQTALAAVDPGDTVVAAFQAAGNRSTGAAYPCLNGQEYGIGVLARIPAANHGHTTDGDIYPVQDPDDPEERAWVCLRATDLFAACTTHLTNTVPAITLAQCADLLRRVVPAVRARGGSGELFVLGGDLNVRTASVPQTRSCLSADFPYAGDRGSQYVLTTGGATLGPATVIDMHQVTDHPGILVTVSPASSRVLESRQSSATADTPRSVGTST
jgi:hypothetical protein